MPKGLNGWQYQRMINRGEASKIGKFLHEPNSIAWEVAMRVKEVQIPSMTKWSGNEWSMSLQEKLAGTGRVRLWWSPNVKNYLDENLCMFKGLVRHWKVIRGREMQSKLGMILEKRKVDQETWILHVAVNGKLWSMKSIIQSVAMTGLEKVAKSK